MIKGLLMRLIARNKEFILSQVLSVKDLMRLLMKNRNTGALIIFLLPGGSLPLPILAEVLDRRKKIRAPLLFPTKAPRTPEPSNPFPVALATGMPKGKGGDRSHPLNECMVFLVAGGGFEPPTFGL